MIFDIDPIFVKYLKISTLLFISIFLLSIFIFPFIYQMHSPIPRDQIRILSITPPLDFFKSLILNNSIASFIIVMSGLTAIEYFPMIFLSYNAFYIGELIAVLNKPDTFMMIPAMVPHAIIELPAMILATTFGCYLAYKLKKSTNTKNFIEYLHNNSSINSIVFKYGIKKYLMIIFPLILLAGIIESGISLYILKSIFNT